MIYNPVGEKLVVTRYCDHSRRYHTKRLDVWLAAPRVSAVGLKTFGKLHKMWGNDWWVWSACRLWNTLNGVPSYGEGGLDHGADGIRGGCGYTRMADAGSLPQWLAYIAVRRRTKMMRLLGDAVLTMTPVALDSISNDACKHGLQQCMSQLLKTLDRNSRSSY